LKQKRQEYQSKYPESVMVLQTEGITTEPDKAYKPKIESEATLKKLDGMLKAYAIGVQLMVDGKAVGIVKDQETANAVVAGSEEALCSGGCGDAIARRTVEADGSHGFNYLIKDRCRSSGIGGKIREQVTIEPIKADPNKVLDLKEAVKVLTEGKDAPLVYEVQEGDTVSGIAKRFEITQADIFRNNPTVKELSLQIGDRAAADGSTAGAYRCNGGEGVRADRHGAGS
jgi:LysM repeat protein